jgi:tetratricopeptide repeat protein 21B
MLALAHLHLTLGDEDECNRRCQLLLKVDKDNDAATLVHMRVRCSNHFQLLADLLYQRNEGGAALVHFQQLLDRNPNQYHALARLLELSWRMGELDDKYLRAAAEHSVRAPLEPGYNYCRGLYEW